jgi:hypothetical protein
LVSARLDARSPPTADRRHLVDYELSILINSPLPEVFEYVTNPSNIPKRAIYIQEAAHTQTGPVGIGTEIKQIIR